MAENKQLKNVIFWLQSQGYISSQKELAQKLGYNEAFISQMVSGNKAISGKFIEKVIEFSKFKVNPKYLEGLDVPMLINEEQVPVVSSNLPESHKYIEALESLITYKDKEIAQLSAMVMELKSKIARLQRAGEEEA